MKFETGIRALALAVGIVAVSSAQASADNREVIKAECAKQLELSPGGCTCIADRADTELNAIQQEFLIAAVTEDQSLRTDLLTRIKPNEMNEVMAFMNSAPQTCAAQ